MSIATEIQRIESAKADIKNAIINKGVEVGDGLIDTYAEKIGKIPSGDEKYQEGYEQGYTQGYEKGSMPIYYLQTMDFTWQKAVYPQNTDLVIRIQKPKANHNAMFSNSRNIKTLKMICDDKSVVVDLSQFVRTSEELEVLDLTEYNRNISSLYYFAYCADNLKTILGALDLTNCTDTRHAFTMSYGKGSLEDIEFVPNTIKISIDFGYCSKLTNKSIQSIFDGLATVETAQTLTLYSSLKILQSEVDSANAKGWTVVGGTVVSEEEYYV